MPRVATEWVWAPDGLLARVVGPWVVRKTHHVDRFVDIFVTAMKGKWDGLGYVELFSGPGVSFDRVRREYLEGSPLRALRRDFTDYAFVDLDPLATGTLLKRIEVTPPGPRRVLVKSGDCNDQVDAIRSAIPRRALTLAFVDPTNWQVRFDTIARLVDGRSTDLLFTFHVGAMRRMVKTASTPALDAFFGTGAWRDTLTRPMADRTRALVDLYNEQLASLGYLRGAAANAVSVRNSREVTMYQLVLFSRHELGGKFWREAQRVNELGQRTLWE